MSENDATKCAICDKGRKARTHFGWSGHTFMSRREQEARLIADVIREGDAVTVNGRPGVVIRSVEGHDHTEYIDGCHAQPHHCDRYVDPDCQTCWPDGGMHGYEDDNEPEDGRQDGA